MEVVEVVEVRSRLHVMESFRDLSRGPCRVGAVFLVSSGCAVRMSQIVSSSLSSLVFRQAPRAFSGVQAFVGN